MLAEVEFIVLPYDSASGRSVLGVLVEELNSGRWNNFRAAVAFVKDTGMFDNLLESLGHFVEEGGAVSITCGADVFRGKKRGTDLEAVKKLLEVCGDSPNAKVYLYHEGGRTFHPKIYLFTNKDTKSALMIVGSSNITWGGLFNNVEASTLVRFDLSEEGHRDVLEKVESYFDQYWTEEA